MNEIIKLKATYLMKALIWLAIIGISLCILIFLSLKIDLCYRYFLSMILIFLGLLIVFYINKNEPEKIIIKGDEIEFTFYNKIFFKRKVYICQKKELKPKVKEDVLELYKKNKVIVKIRKIALSNKDWEKVKALLSPDKRNMNK